jgi:hypothetical protein
VTKVSWPAKLHQPLQSIRPAFLVVKGHSDDDLFMLNAAFELDPSATHILTNDHFEDHKAKLVDPLAKVFY